MENEHHWKSKTLYLEDTTGEHIVEKQKELNSVKDQFVVATQIFPVNIGNKLSITSYNVFIYYKCKYDVV